MTEKLQKVHERGYYGVSREVLPEELRTRVESALISAKKYSGELSFYDVTDTVEWEFGEYNNAFFLDNGCWHYSLHRVGDRIFRSSVAGGVGATHEIAEIAEALGLDETAEVVREPIKFKNNFERQTMLNGPVLGTK